MTNTYLYVLEYKHLNNIGDAMCFMSLLLLGYWLNKRNRDKEKESQMEREIDFIRSENRHMIEEREKQNANGNSVNTDMLNIRRETIARPDYY